MSIATAARRPQHELTYWGPARHDPEHPLRPRGSDFDPLDLRDAAAERPDDN